MKRLTILISALLSMFLTANSQSLTIDLKTKPAGGSFSPRHILAVWVEDTNGVFVKTLYLKAATRRQYLYSWNAASGGNTTDAVTGATINSHTSHHVTWNCLGLNGQPVSPAFYRIKVEFTEKHAQGPMHTMGFTVNNSNQTYSDSNLTYFDYVVLNYDPTGLKADDLAALNLVELWPNPADNQVNLHFDPTAVQEGTLTISQLSGAIIYERDLSRADLQQTIIIETSSWAKAVYLITYKSKGQIFRQKLVIE